MTTETDGLDVLYGYLALIRADGWTARSRIVRDAMTAIYRAWDPSLGIPALDRALGTLYEQAGRVYVTVPDFRGRPS
jgi:hypothetical protein